MRKFAWAMKYKTGDDRWKGLALTKRASLRIGIPKRQFMGHSKQLDRQIISSVKTAFKSLFNRK
jgi:phage gpG-like protein